MFTLARSMTFILRFSVIDEDHLVVFDCLQLTSSRMIYVAQIQHCDLGFCQVHMNVSTILILVDTAEQSQLLWLS